MNYIQETNGKRAGAGGKHGAPAYTLRPPYPTLNLTTKRTENNLLTQDWIGNKSCLVTIDTEACVTVPRPDIVAVCPEREPSQHYRLTTASGKSLHILKEALVEMTRGRKSMSI
jgi:hypothetical protein